jgi:hypothetical protein
VRAQHPTHFSSASPHRPPTTCNHHFHHPTTTSLSTKGLKAALQDRLIEALAGGSADADAADAADDDQAEEAEAAPEEVTHSPPFIPPSLPLSLARPLTPSLTHSLPHSFTHSLSCFYIFILQRTHRSIALAAFGHLWKLQWQTWSQAVIIMHDTLLMVLASATASMGHC